MVHNRIRKEAWIESHDNKDATADEIFAMGSYFHFYLKKVQTYFPNAKINDSSYEEAKDNKIQLKVDLMTYEELEKLHHLSSQEYLLLEEKRLKVLNMKITKKDIPITEKYLKILIKNKMIDEE